jgi:C1A family cysteine protease
MERKINGYISHREAIKNKKIKFTKEDLNKVKPFDKVGMKLAKAADLPSKSNNYPNVAPARFNQGDLGLCFAFAGAGIVEYFLKNEVASNPVVEELSEMFLGYYGRYVLNDNEPPEGDDGCTVLATLQALHRFGICKEATWQYKDENENVEPSKAARDEATQVEVGEVFAIPQTQDEDKLTAMKQVLYAGRPLDYGSSVHQSIMNVGSDGLEPYAEPDSEDDPVVGGHSRQVVDYDDDMEIPNAPIKGAFLIMNSWGPDWGSDGTSWVSYQVWLDGETDDMGVTSIKSVTPTPIPPIDPSGDIAKALVLFEEANRLLQINASHLAIRRAKPYLRKGINLLKEVSGE